MADWYEFRIFVTGAGKELVLDWFNRTAEWSSDRSSWYLPVKKQVVHINDGQEELEGNYIGGECGSVKIDSEDIRIDGCSEWSPPHEVVEALSRQFPDLTFGMSADDCFQGRYMYFEFKAGKRSLLECKYYDRNQDIEYVSDGVQHYRLPWWAEMEDLSSLPEAPIEKWWENAVLD